MALLSDPKMLALWRSRFQRFSNSDLTVAQFCAAERVAVSSFYRWRKKIGEQARCPIAPARSRNDSRSITSKIDSQRDCKAFRSRQITTTQHRKAFQSRQAATAEDRGFCSEDRDVFQSQAGSAQDHNAFQPLTVKPATCGVSVRLPSGTRIEIGTAHLDAIRAVIAEVIRIEQVDEVSRVEHRDEPLRVEGGAKVKRRKRVAEVARFEGEPEMSRGDRSLAIGSDSTPRSQAASMDRGVASC